MKLESKLFIKKIILNKDQIDQYDKYQFNIKIIKEFKNITIQKPVTFL